MFIKKIVKQSIGASLFSATWIKADGKPRTILGKLPTNEKFFNGGELKGNREHLLEVIDITLLKKNKDKPKEVWRSVNLDKLTSLKIGGIEWVK
tara:strand:+ start:216 stop:497 length:282 start_codon:yes stop_codon:yes gene_type:complete